MNFRILEDDELRHLFVNLLLLPSARTRQKRVGASNLSNQCDRCLARDLLGKGKDSRQGWLKRELGTAAHKLAEERLKEGLEGFPAGSDLIRALATGAKAENHVWFGDIAGYGRVGGSIDLDLPGNVGDYKGSNRAQSAFLQDAMQLMGGYREGLPPRWKKNARGGWDLVIASSPKTTAHVSDAQYDAEIDKMIYKMQGYYGQQCLYGLGRELEGRPVDRCSIIWINRDGTGFYDDPDGAEYANEEKVRDIWVLTFAYSAEYARSLLKRAEHMWAELSSGATPSDFDSHEKCFTCSRERQDAERASMNLTAPVLAA